METRNQSVFGHVKDDLSDIKTMLKMITAKLEKQSPALKSTLANNGFFTSSGQSSHLMGVKVPISGSSVHGGFAHSLGGIQLLSPGNLSQSLLPSPSFPYASMPGLASTSIPYASIPGMATSNPLGHVPMHGNTHFHYPMVSNTFSNAPAPGFNHLQQLSTHNGNYSNSIPLIEYNMLKFDGGEDVRSWISKCERVFILENTPQNCKVQRATMALEGSAFIWHRVYIHQKLGISWQDYSQAIIKRFDKRKYAIKGCSGEESHTPILSTQGMDTSSSSTFNENEAGSSYKVGIHMFAHQENEATIDFPVGYIQQHEEICPEEDGTFTRDGHFGLLNESEGRLHDLIWNNDTHCVNIAMTSQSLNEGAEIHVDYEKILLYHPNSEHQSCENTWAVEEINKTLHNYDNVGVFHVRTIVEEERIGYILQAKDEMIIENNHDMQDSCDAQSKDSDKSQKAPILMEAIDKPLGSAITIIMISSQQKFWLQDHLFSNNMQENIIFCEYQGTVEEDVEKQLRDKGLKPEDTQSGEDHVMNMKALQEFLKKYSAFGEVKYFSGRYQNSMHEMVQISIYLLKKHSIQRSNNAYFIPSNSMRPNSIEFANSCAQASIVSSLMKNNCYEESITASIKSENGLVDPRSSWEVQRIQEKLIILIWGWYYKEGHNYFKEVMRKLKQLLLFLDLIQHPGCWIKAWIIAWFQWIDTAVANNCLHPSNKKKYKVWAEKEQTWEANHISMLYCSRQGLVHIRRASQLILEDKDSFKEDGLLRSKLKSTSNQQEPQQQFPLNQA